MFQVFQTLTIWAGRFIYARTVFSISM